MQTLSRLESMMERFVATQTIKNKEFRKQNLHINETLRQLNIVVESLVTHNMALETQISLLEKKCLGPSHEEHVDVVTTSSARQSENPEESDNEVEEISGDKRVEIKKNTLTPPEREVFEEVDKETPYVVPPPYTPPISFPKIFMEVRVDSKSKSYVEVL